MSASRAPAPVSTMESPGAIKPGMTLAEAMRVRGIVWGGMNTSAGIKTLLIDGGLQADGTMRVIWAEPLPSTVWGDMLDAKYTDLLDPLSAAAQACPLTPDALDELCLLVEDGASADFEVGF